MRELMARLKLPASLKATGEREVSSLLDVETGFGNFIASRFDGATISDKDAPRNKGVLAFLAKKPEQRVICGQFDDLQTTLMAMSAKEHAVNALPVVHVSLPNGFAFADGEAYRDVEMCGTITRDNKVVAVTYKMFIRSTATVTILAEDKPTAYALATALATAVRLNVSLGSGRFQAKTKFCGTPVTLAGEIEMPKSISFDPVPISFKENRVWGLTASLDIISEMYLAMGVESRPATLEVYQGGALN